MAQAKQKFERAPLGSHLQRGLREGALFVFIFAAVYCLVALSSYAPEDPGWTNSSHNRDIANLGGRAGAWFADIVLAIFGYLAYMIPLMVVYAGWLIYRQMSVPKSEWRVLLIRGVGFVFTLASSCGLASLYDTQTASALPQHVSAGGILGDLVKTGMTFAFNQLGATLLLLALFFSGFTLFTHLSWFRIMDTIGAATLTGIGWCRFRVMTLVAKLRGRREQVQREETVKIRIEREKVVIAEREPPRIAPVIKEPKISVREQKERQVPLFRTDGEAELPPLALLDSIQVSAHPVAKEALEHISRMVEHKLADFGVEVRVVAVHPGPVITRYELQPAAGVKVSQISNLSKDLARALSAISVRIVEVIPGKSTVGLEIPNEFRETVQLIDTLKANEFEHAKSPLALALGKDISGVPVVADLSKMPHLLVAGTTGAGKSVALNAMLLSILYNAKPEDVRMILIDPKMLELSIYEGIPHLLAPVVTDMKDAANALRWCVAEMDRRYQLMAALKVRNIAGFNKKIKEAKDKGEPVLNPLHPKESLEPPAELDKLPYIVVIVDELADMMMLVGKKVEQLIARLAQKARAAGVHLILATQRPSVDVLTGLIKANIPTRIAFQVSSKIDSRTILDQQGAESLLGHGDMLYMPPGTGVPIRVHGAFVSDNEVQRVVEHLKQSAEPQYEEDILNGPADPGAAISLTGIDPADSNSESDPLYDEAVRIVTESRRASISGVQRRLKVGYNRAARMIEAMEAAGLVGPLESNGNREVLAPPPPKD